MNTTSPGWKAGGWSYRRWSSEWWRSPNVHSRRKFGQILAMDARSAKRKRALPAQLLSKSFGDSVNRVELRGDPSRRRAAARVA